MVYLSWFYLKPLVRRSAVFNRTIVKARFLDFSEISVRVLSIKKRPGYRGKPESFDPAKVGKRNIPKPPPKSKAGPKSPMLPPPSHLQTKESPQKNDSLITEAIFGVDVSVTEIAPKQPFSANYSKIVDIAVIEWTRNNSKE
ncbi:hypothetical protein L798_13652 [Zootermopsis nevadensis]|uniref:Uncharacterized protein n=1 Tax=Zootermopsis nevadensis TaxID=136037 RepID=A0A067R169_ZOONE|nr:hypothetical protein L798_13652 [Zootermopsis nevadensis]